jgi:hypothetical protein
MHGQIYLKIYITWVYTENELSWLEFIILLKEWWNIQRISFSIVKSLLFLCNSIVITPVQVAVRSKA